MLVSHACEYNSHHISLVTVNNLKEVSLLKITLIFVLCVHLSVGRYVCEQTWRSEDTLLESLLSFHHFLPGLVRLGSKCFHSLSRFTPGESFSHILRKVDIISLSPLQKCIFSVR